MRVKTDVMEPTKLCHAKPGDVVVLLGEELTAYGPPYLVAIVPDPSKHASRGLSMGLYDEGRTLLLVDLGTGEVRMKETISLSQRCYTHRQAEVTLRGPLTSPV